MLPPIFVWNTYTVIYDLSVYLMTFDLVGHFKVKSNSRSFKGLYLINGAWFDKSLYNILIVSRICPFSLPYNILPLIKLKDKSRPLGFQWAIFHKPSTLWPKFIINTYKKSWHLNKLFQFQIAAQVNKGWHSRLHIR